MNRGFYFVFDRVIRNVIFILSESCFLLLFKDQTDVELFGGICKFRCFGKKLQVKI